MQSGELVVISKDSVTVNLKGAPAEVQVYFEHELEVVPCNPQHFDELSWEVVQQNGLFMLRINWGVTGVRVIKWKVCY